ncbi:MAG TPA: sigma-70 family RNA polymerase sigma factor [Actinomycetota bacterium]|nr:sigma-70 family RNA polymerase sigma factor [Actinomycetota bacterium]
MIEERTDHELIAAHLGGDRHAFDRIVERYEKRVWAVCLRMCGDPDDARDAAQDTFVTAFRSIGSFRGDAQLSTWLHRIAVNASLDVLRKRGRNKSQPVEDVPEIASDEAGPEEQAVRASRAAAVHAALTRLSEEHRTVIVLHDLQGLQYPEVAEALDVPVGTVKSRLHRARTEMARLLGHLKDDGTEGPASPSNVSRNRR